MRTSQAIATIRNAEKTPQQLTPKEKKARISARLKEVIHLVVSGECKTVKAAAERTGMSPTYLSGAFRKPEVRVFIERCARETIAAGTMRASARMIELIDASSEHVSADVSKHMLAIAGIKPAAEAQVSVNIDIKAGYIIDLSEPEDIARDVTPQTEL